MEALVYDAKTASLRYETNYPMPKIVADNDVIVKVAYSGVCGTDLHIIQGEFPVMQDRPFPLGHEFSGVIHQVGAAVNLKKGQKVVVDPNRPCNICDHCRKAQYQFCQAKANIGLWRDGGWAQYVCVPNDQVFLLPEHVSLEEGGLCEPYSCVSHGYDRALPLNIGNKILVVGAGIIGNLWITTLHHQGHRDVTVSEMNKYRLDIVSKLETGFRLITPDVLEKEKDNLLYDVIIDCTGVAKVMEISFNYLSPGGKYVVFGCSPPTHRASLSPYEMFNKEVTIIAVKVNPFSFPTAIAWLGAMGHRYLDYEKLGIKTYKLSEYQDALKDLKCGSISKAMLKID